MNNRPVLFIDSGIGGLPYCMDFIKNNPQEDAYYFADRENFPYGSRSKEDLISILTAHIEKSTKTIDPKIAVLACNSATVSALESLRKSFPQIPFVGTVPAIKPAANASRSKKVGVLGTARTIDDPYNQNLANGDCEIIGIAAPDLVEFIEQRFEKAGKNEKTEIVKKYIDPFRAGNVDTIVLGCTHFLFLLEDFRREAAPSIKVFDSIDGITKRIEFLLDEKDGALRAEKDCGAEYRLYITGGEKENSLWNERAKRFGFNLLFFDEL